jgi:hypothetical protein
VIGREDTGWLQHSDRALVTQETPPVKVEHRVFAVGFLDKVGFEIFGSGNIVKREELKDLMLSKGRIYVTKSAKEAIVKDISLLCCDELEDLQDKGGDEEPEGRKGGGYQDVFGFADKRETRVVMGRVALLISLEDCWDGSDEDLCVGEMGLEIFIHSVHQIEREVGMRSRESGEGRSGTSRRGTSRASLEYPDEQSHLFGHCRWSKRKRESWRAGGREGRRRDLDESPANPHSPDRLSEVFLIGRQRKSCWLQLNGEWLTAVIASASPSSRTSSSRGRDWAMTMSLGEEITILLIAIAVTQEAVSTKHWHLIHF